MAEMLRFLSFFIFTFVAFVFGVKPKNIVTKPHAKELMLFSSGWMVSALAMMFLGWSLLWCEVGVQFRSFACGFPVFPRNRY